MGPEVEYEINQTLDFNNLGTNFFVSLTERVLVLGRGPSSLRGTYMLHFLFVIFTKNFPTSQIEGGVRVGVL